MKIVSLLLLLTISLFSHAITEDLEYQKISGVGYSWSHVSFANNYSDAIVVCSNVLPSSNDNEAVVRVNNISSTGFDVKIQRPQDSDAGYSTDVYCIVSDEGSYSVPFKYEAHKVLSTGTSGQYVTDDWSASNTEDVSNAIVQTYTKPAVLGQVMSFNDAKFSTFWSFDCDNRKNRPFQDGMADGICVGKHIGQINESRANETLGYMVAEAGVYELKDFSIAVDYGADSVKGVGDSPAYSYTLDKSYSEGVVTQEAMDGVNGSWSVLYGNTPFGTTLDLAVDEETVANDTTRKHTSENVAYWLFAYDPITPAEMKINEVLYQEVTGGSSNEEFIEFYVTQSGNLKNYLTSDQDGKSHQYRFPKHAVSKGDYIVLHTGTGIDSVNGNVHHFYQNSTELLNNTGDEILLIKPSNDDTTIVDGEIISGYPFDYMSYISAGDGIPTSTNGVTLSWDSSEISRLDNASDGTSISLTPNGQDGDSSLCWELTATTIGSEKATNCTNYIATVDSNTNANMVNSIGSINTLLPDIKLSKTSVTIYDPINGTTNPKAIPNALVKYTIDARNEGLGKADSDTLVLTDAVPAKMKMCVSTVSQCKEVTFVDGAISSELTLGTVKYSDNGGSDFTYTPTADAEGFDMAVTNIQVKLDGAFKESDGTNHPSFDIELYMGVK